LNNSQPGSTPNRRPYFSAALRDSGRLPFSWLISVFLLMSRNARAASLGEA
jgi:hypothetical protein